MFSIQQRDSVGPSRRVGVARVLTIIFHNLVLETCASVDRTKVNNNQQSSPATQNGGLDSIGSNTSTQVLNFRDLIRRAAARNNIDDRWCAWPGKRRRASLYLICETPVFAFHLHVVFCITWTGAKHINSRHLRVFIRVSVLLNARKWTCQNVPWTTKILLRSSWGIGQLSRPESGGSEKALLCSTVRITISKCLLISANGFFHQDVGWKKPHTMAAIAVGVEVTSVSYGARHQSLWQFWMVGNIRFAELRYLRWRAAEHRIG